MYAGDAIVGESHQFVYSGYWCWYGNLLTLVVLPISRHAILSRASHAARGHRNEHVGIISILPSLILEFLIPSEVDELLHQKAEFLLHILGK